MILPTKHISPSRSLLGLGSVILQHLKKPQTVTRLWDRVRKHPDMVTFNQFVLTLDLLYSMGVVGMEEGLIRKQKQ